MKKTSKFKQQNSQMDLSGFNVGALRSKIKLIHDLFNTVVVFDIINKNGITGMKININLFNSPRLLYYFLF
jgi:hypothetical protein